MIALLIAALFFGGASATFIVGAVRGDRTLKYERTPWLAIMGAFAVLACGLTHYMVTEPTVVRQAATTDLVELSGAYVTADGKGNYTYFVKGEHGSVERAVPRDAASIRTSSEAKVVTYERQFSAGIIWPWAQPAQPGYVFHIPEGGLSR